MAKRRTKKEIVEGEWTNVAQQILHHTSMLAYLLRDPLAVSLEQVHGRLKRFMEAFLKSGEGDVLPCSGKDADEDGALCDVDVTDAVNEIVYRRLCDLRELEKE